MGKVLSIVVPVYNTEKYLDRCLTSLLIDKDTNKDIEVILVNDGSTDGSLSIMKKYKKLYPGTIVVVDKPNAGHGSAINAGFKKATGKYFRIIDSDDWINPLDFPEYVKVLKHSDSDIVLTNFRREMTYSGDTIFYSYKRALEEGKEYVFDEFDVKKLKDDYFYLATTTYKTEVLRKAKLHLDENTFYVDMEYNIFPIPFVKTFVYYNFDIYRYFIGRQDQSVSDKSMVRNRHHHEKVVKKLVKFYSQLDASDNKKQYIAKILKLLLRTHYFIFCSMNVGKQGRKEIIAFDRFLKETSPELYQKTDYSFIKWNRRTNFAFCQKFKNVFSKAIIIRE